MLSLNQTQVKFSNGANLEVVHGVVHVMWTLTSLMLP